MTTLKDIENQLGEEFKKDAKEAWTKMLQVRDDLQDIYNNKAYLNNVLSSWPLFHEHIREEILKVSSSSIAQLGMVYGAEQYLVCALCPDVSIGAHWKEMHDKQVMLKKIEEVLSSTLEEDFLCVREYFQGQRNPPLIRFNRKSGEQVGYSKPQEVLYWFTIERRLLTAAFLVYILRFTKGAIEADENEDVVLNMPQVEGKPSEAKLIGKTLNKRDWADNNAKPTDNKNPQQRSVGNAAHIEVEGNTGCCAHCKVQGIECKACSACKRVYYCGKECQRADWGRHKPMCTR